jgi:CO/xanthine dehydrogenase Mo-binding subunit
MNTIRLLRSGVLLRRTAVATGRPQDALALRDGGVVDAATGTPLAAVADLVGGPHPDSPYGLNGVGEPPTLSSTPAILNALRDASGLELSRTPVRPDDFTSHPRAALVHPGQ